MTDPAVGVDGGAREDLHGLRWHHVDVFSNEPLSGNGLSVFPDAAALPPELLQRLTQEMRQFESIFLSVDWNKREARARIFTMEEELDFAGHPIIGAAAVLHHLADAEGEQHWRFVLNEKTVDVKARSTHDAYRADMDQGPASWGATVAPGEAGDILEALSLAGDDLAPDLPLQVVSTGLPYLLVPVRPRSLARARILGDDFEARIGRFGAKFVYVLDPNGPEGRTWDNAGQIEDVATGSAAGPAGAYLHRHAGAPAEMTLHQGRFVDRPSTISVTIDPATGHVGVGGDVVLLAGGRFR